jgi:hypothetical protein
VEDLSDHLVEVVGRLLGVHASSVRLSQAQPDADDAGGTPVVLLGGAELAALLERSVSAEGIALRVIRVSDAQEAVEAVTHEDAIAVFCAWEDAEPATRELLHRVQSSSWMASIVTIVLTSGSADELSMAYALGARVAVTTPQDTDGFVQLLAQLDKMLGTA